MSSPAEWYKALPIVSRVWLSGAVLTALGSRFGWFDAWTVAFVPSLVFQKLQVWRLFGNFFYFGDPSFNWLIRMIMLAQYAPALERDPFPSGGGPRMGNTADFLWMVIIGVAVNLSLGWVFGMKFLSFAMLSAVIYVWSKRHPETQTSFYGFGFKAAYLPFVLLAFTVIVNGDVYSELFGIGAGHLYYFLQEVLPNVDSPLKEYRLLRTPDFLYRALGLPPTHAAAAFVHMRVGGGAPVPPRGGGGYNWGTGGVPLGR